MTQWLKIFGYSVCTRSSVVMLLFLKSHEDIDEVSDCKKGKNGMNWDGDEREGENNIQSANS